MDELYPLSWLSQYGYCPRRCGLLALEQQWIENAETAAGRYEHQRVHTARCERKGRDIFLYEQPVFSRDLGVNGKCDCVEAHPDPGGVELPYGTERYTLYPIEYKHGVVRQEEEYQIQLCAQAICLEAQFSCTISRGAIFYIDAHRRDEVILDEALRKKTMDVAKAVADLLEKQVIPSAKYGPKCKRCSLAEICQPKWKHSAKQYCSKLWCMVQGEDVE